jgi:uncharacterized protein (TIGR00299 family) protein
LCYHSNVIAYLDCYSGISGDMTLGALVDAGLEIDDLRAALASLPVAGYRLQAEPVVSKGISGTRVTVELDAGEQPHRHLSDVEAIIDGSRLSENVKARAKAVFKRLAEAEAHVHGEPVERVHFHEVGAVDAIVDVVGAVWGFDHLGIERAFVSPLPTGSGKVRSAHGPIPVPAPATLEIARRAGAPLVPSTAETELVTPTGAALAAELGEFRQPPMTVERVGYGFGRKELPWANALRLWVGQPVGASGSDQVSLLETNLDDMSPELIGAAMERLFAAGALDVFFTPIHMKKNRPATMLSAIVPIEREAELAALILRETSTLGVRVDRRWRYKADRWSGTADTPWGPVRVKIKSLDGALTAAPEYEDCIRIAREQNVPIADVYAAARQAPPRNDAR